MINMNAKQKQSLSYTFGAFVMWTVIASYWYYNDKSVGTVFLTGLVIGLTGAGVGLYIHYEEK